MRRRLFLGIVGSGLAGLAGCPGLQGDRDGPPPPTETERTSPPRTARESDTETRPPRPGRLRFADEIGQTTRERCRRALERVRTITGAGLAEDVWIRYMDFQPYSNPHPVYRWIRSSVPDAQVLPPADTDVPDVAGRYDHGDRTIYLTEPSQLPETVLDDLPGEPAFSYENYPNEPFLAHELAHAVQFDTVQIAPAADTLDAGTASVGVKEGTAAYVQHRYGVACQDGRYDPCQYREAFPSVDALPPWLISLRLPYINGMLFAVEAFRRGGWETVWDAHRNPPETAWALLYPAAYFDDGFTVERPPAHDDPPDGLVRDTTLHPGIAPLYVLLRALGAVDPQDPAAELGAELQAETGREWAFGAAILRGWRGGRLSLYADRQAYRWDTTWADADAAGDVATAIRKAYREAYDGEDGVWEVGEAVVTVGRDGSMVRQTLGRMHEEAVALRDEA